MKTTLKTLLETSPYEFRQEFRDTAAWKLKDVEVVEVVDSYKKRWPGKEKNVHRWWRLANGKAVGWNENPARGWSFPVIKLK